MNEWYYSNSGSKSGPVSELALLELCRSGDVSNETLIWNQNMSDWIRLDETEFGRRLVSCAFSGGLHPESEMLPYGEDWVTPEHKDKFVQSLREGGRGVAEDLVWREYKYIDPGKRAIMAKGGMIFVMVVVFLWFIGCVIYGAYLGSVDKLDQFDEQKMNILGLIIVLPAFVIGQIFYVMWVYRVSKNAHAISAQPMDQTPGWAVGFHFVPIAVLWKPFVAIREIWNVSQGLSLTTGSQLLGWWWGCWLTYSFTSNFLPFVGYVAGLAACILAWMFITKITKWQQKIGGRE